MADFDPTDYDGHADDPLAVLEGQEIDELGGKGPQVSSVEKLAPRSLGKVQSVCESYNTRTIGRSYPIIMSYRSIISSYPITLDLNLECIK